MKPDWDALGEEFENSKKVIVGDVDCTQEKSKKLCEDQGVKGYPTIKYYLPGDREGIDYKGERDLASLKAFTKTLGPPCAPKNLKACSEKEKAELETYVAKDAAALAEAIATSQSQLTQAESEHQELLKSLQAQYEAASAELQKLKESNEPAIRLMKAALKDKEADAAEAAPKAEL